MIDFQEEGIRLRSEGLIKGSRPLFIDIIDSSSTVKGKYLLTLSNDRLLFYQLKKNYRLMTKNADNFYLMLESFVGYHYAYHKEFYKRITLNLKGDSFITFLFLIGHEEAYGNEENALKLMQFLKEKGIRQQNEIRRDNDGAKQIKKVDQLFVKEIRAPEKRKGLFKR